MPTSREKKKSASRVAPRAGSSGLPMTTGIRGGRQLLIRQRLGFTRPQFARLVPVSERSLADIEKGKPAGEAVKRSVTQIQRLVTGLEEVMDRSTIGPWMTTPNEAFDGLKPLEVVERGETDRIWSMIYQLRSGTPF